MLSSRRAQVGSATASDLDVSVCSSVSPSTLHLLR
jgi:hypothetical protein